MISSFVVGQQVKGGRRDYCLVLFFVKVLLEEGKLFG